MAHANENTSDPAPPAPPAPSPPRSRLRPVVSIAVLAGLFALGGLGFERVRRSSVYRLRLGSPAERVAAIKDSSFAERPVALGRITPALKDRSPEVRRAAVSALEEMSAREAAWAVSWLCVNDPDAGVREKACRFSGAFADERHVPAVAGALDDPDPAVRAEAVTALAALGAKKTRKRVAGLLEDHDERVRAAAIRALGEIGTREEVPFLVARLGLEEDVDKSIIQGSLIRLTGTNQGLDPKRWWRYLELEEWGGSERKGTE